MNTMLKSPQNKMTNDFNVRNQSLKTTKSIEKNEWDFKSKTRKEIVPKFYK